MGPTSHLRIGGGLARPMHKHLACREIGMDCEYVAHGDSPEELKKDFLAHAGHHHPKEAAAMTPEKMAKIESLVKSKFKESAGERPRVLHDRR